MDRLDRDHIAARSLSIHAPDLDDVFFALTGRSDTDTRRSPIEGDVPMTTLSYTLADSKTMLRRNLVRASATRSSST